LPRYDVMLRLDDGETQTRLEIYQQVIRHDACSDDEVVRIAKEQFCDWAQRHGSEWEQMAGRIPDAKVQDTEIRVSD